VQTQLIYNVERFRAYMEQVRALGLHERVYILAGVGPLKSVRQASYMATQVAGMDVPQDLVDTDGEDTEGGPAGGGNSHLL